MFRAEYRKEAEFVAAAEELYEDASFVDQHDGPSHSTRFTAPISFFFGGKRFMPLVDCIVFKTTRYEWCIQAQSGSMIYAREPRS